MPPRVAAKLFRGFGVAGKRWVERRGTGVTKESGTPWYAWYAHSPTCNTKGEG